MEPTVVGTINWYDKPYSAIVLTHNGADLMVYYERNFDTPELVYRYEVLIPRCILISNMVDHTMMFAAIRPAFDQHGKYIYHMIGYDESLGVIPNWFGDPDSIYTILDHNRVPLVVLADHLRSDDLMKRAQGYIWVVKAMGISEFGQPKVLGIQDAKHQFERAQAIHNFPPFTLPIFSLN